MISVNYLMLRDLLMLTLSPRDSLIEWLVSLEGNTIYESICWNVLRQCDAIDFNNKHVFDEFLDRLNIAIADPANASLLSNPEDLIKFVIYNDTVNYTPANNFCLMGNSILSGYAYCNLGSSPDCYNPLSSSKSLEEELCKFEPFSSFKMNAIYDSSASFEDPDYYTEKVLNGDIPKPLTPLRGSRPFCWVTRKKAIERIIASKNTKMLISELGLLHYVEKEEKFVLTTYPAKFTFSKLCKPTVLEGVHIPFRLDSTDDPWGKTVDLMTGEPCQPEAVHCPHTRNHNFEYDEWDRNNNFIDEIDLALLLNKGKT